MFLSFSFKIVRTVFYSIDIDKILQRSQVSTHYETATEYIPTTL